MQFPNFLRDHKMGLFKKKQINNSRSYDYRRFPTTVWVNKPWNIFANIRKLLHSESMRFSLKNYRFVIRRLAFIPAK